MGNNAALGLRLAVVTLHRIAVLVENRDLQVLVAHHNWELERLTNLVSVRSKGHDASHRINRNLILSDALRQCAKLELRLRRLGFYGVGSRVVELRVGGSRHFSLRLDLVVLKVFTSHSEGIQSQNQIVLWIWIVISKLQASSERITSLGIRRNLEGAAGDLSRSISFSGLTGLDDFAALVYPLDVVGQILSDRQTGGISLNRIADRCPVISGVLIHYIELQGLRRKRDVPTRVAIGGALNQDTVATEELCVSASVQISAEARARPLAKSPRIQRANIFWKRLTISAKNAEVAPVHIDVLGLKVTVKPGTFFPRTSQLMQLCSRRVNATTRTSVVVTVDALPEQLEPTISASSGGNRLGNPAFWIRSYLLINPALQTLFVSRSPITPTQSLTRKVILRVLFNLGHGLVVEVRANHFQTSSSDILASEGTHSVVA